MSDENNRCGHGCLLTNHCGHCLAVKVEKKDQEITELKEVNQKLFKQIEESRKGIIDLRDEITLEVLRLQNATGRPQIGKQGCVNRLNQWLKDNPEVTNEKTKII